MANTQNTKINIGRKEHPNPPPLEFPSELVFLNIKKSFRSGIC